MANPPFPNEYNLRTVAEASSKACFVCHRSSTKVLITTDNKVGKQYMDYLNPTPGTNAFERGDYQLFELPLHIMSDFFYTCPSHLTDRGFATPIIDEKAEAEKKKQEQLAKETEAIIKEYEEKLKKKGKDEKKKEDPAKTAEDEKDQKLKALDAKVGTSTPVADDGPRQYTLHSPADGTDRNFYQMRLDRRTNMERAKREQSRMKDPTFFPAAPKGDVA
ncbi:hypothetical protein PMZ80_005620 [Knufia obscura]|uniref:Uncharacterized protein n=1 Tax=Knufia obscura TaxID=1635080 RepID=A0ABR0RM38_9EURO|nr:hypothetical protein PMZ80_005620 [Knufia obscura]